MRILLLLVLLTGCISESRKTVVDLRPNWEQTFMTIDDSMQIDFSEMMNLADSLECDTVSIQFSLSPEGSDTTYFLSPIARCRKTMGCILFRPRNYMKLTVDTIQSLYSSDQLKAVLLNHILNPERSPEHASHPRKSIIVIQASNEMPGHQVKDALVKLAIAYNHIHFRFSDEVTHLPFQLGTFWPEPPKGAKVDTVKAS